MVSPNCAIIQCSILAIRGVGGRFAPFRVEKIVRLVDTWENYSLFIKMHQKQK